MIGLLLALLGSVTAQGSDNAVCTLSEADRRANARLSFEEFDQTGSTPTSARRLGERGCWKEAAEATADYLIRGPAAPPEQLRVLLFHLGQFYAMAGEEARAADFVAASRRADATDPASDALRWNDYVQGTWAFLRKDREMLIAARDSILSAPGTRNRTNGALLAALERCFDRPYAVAYDMNCGR